MPKTLLRKEVFTFGVPDVSIYHDTESTVEQSCVIHGRQGAA